MLACLCAAACGWRESSPVPSPAPKPSGPGASISTGEGGRRDAEEDGRNHPPFSKIRELGAEQLSSYIVRHQSAVPELDSDSVALLANRLESFSTGQLLECSERIGEPKLLEMLFAIIGKRLPLSSGLDPLKTTALEIPNLQTRKLFLVEYFKSNLEPNLLLIMRSLQAAKELGPEAHNHLWGNQIAADVLRWMPLEKFDEAWNCLGGVSDKSTRRLMAQVLFSTRYLNDSVAASAWLDSLADTDDKFVAIEYMINDLNDAGNTGAAELWRKSLMKSKARTPTEK